MCSEHHVNKRETIKQFFRDLLLLHHAAANAENQTRILLFKLFYKTDIAESSKFGMLPNAACIEKYKISRFFAISFCVAALNKHTRNVFGVMLVHLAAISLDIVGKTLVGYRTVNPLDSIRRLFKFNSSIDCGRVFRLVCFFAVVTHILFILLCIFIHIIHSSGAFRNNFRKFRSQCRIANNKTDSVCCRFILVNDSNLMKQLPLFRLFLIFAAVLRQKTHAIYK